MNFSCETSLFSGCLQNAQKAVSSKTTLPILEGVMLHAENNLLTVTGFDMEIGITKTMPCVCKESGSIVLNAKMISEMIRNLEVPTVTLENTDSFVVKVTGGKTEYTILGLDAGDYPELPSFETDQEISLPQYLLKRMIRQTIFSVGQNENKPVQTGILFEMENKTLKLVACDGVRIAVCCEQMDSSSSVKVIIPGKTMNELARLLSDEKDASVSIQVGKKHICFCMENCRLISRLIEGNFIDYQAAVPKNQKTLVRVKTRELIKCIDKTSLILTDRTKSSIRFKIENEMIRANCQTGMGNANDEIEAVIEGEALTIGFNAKFISDALRASESDEVLLKLSGPLNPLCVLPVEGENFLFLVMPVRMKEEG